jgi:hypothetical protein
VKKITCEDLFALDETDKINGSQTKLISIFQYKGKSAIAPFQ